MLQEPFQPGYVKPVNQLGRLGSLVVRMASEADEIAAAQAIRHTVFSGSGSAILNSLPQSDVQARDEDHFDRFCEHLIVEDSSLDCPIRGKGHGRIVATYRLLPQEIAEAEGGFYSQSEFDVRALTRRHPEKRFLEFGRSCVLPEYRSKRTIELLWHGSWAYVRQGGFDVMFGCASFSGTNASAHAHALDFLRRHAAPEPGWEVAALGEIAPQESCGEGEVEMKRAMRALPPLIKGYLRLGAMFAHDAVIDRAFNTIDVLVLLPLERLNPRYVSYYGADAERHAS